MNTSALYLGAPTILINCQQRAPSHTQPRLKCQSHCGRQPRVDARKRSTLLSRLPTTNHLQRISKRRSLIHTVRAIQAIPNDTPDPQRDPEAALILIACGIGIATGASVVVFNDAIHIIRDAIWHGESLISGRELLRQANEIELWPKVVFPPVLGGIFVGVLGLLVSGYDDDPKDKNPFSTTTAASNNNTNGSSNGSLSSSDSIPSTTHDTILTIARPISRAIAAAVTLGSGASLGPEGPSVDIGRSVARGLGSALKSRELHVTSLIAAGSGAGVAAGFNAPIAGVFFAVETVLQKQMLQRANNNTATDNNSNSNSTDNSSGLTVAMVLLASVLAAVVSQAGLGSSPAFRVPEYRLESLYEIPLYLVFGAVCGVVSASFSFSSRVAGDAFDELRGGEGNKGAITAALLPCIGGLTTGVLGLGYPEILYQGFDNVNTIMSSTGGYAPGLLIQILLMKILATSICRGSGLQGGIYAPSIFMGAALGSAFGELAHAVGDSAGVVLSAPQAYALVGVAAMLASNCAVPLTAVLLLFELTRDYLIIVPTLGAVGISYWISQLAAPGVKSAAGRRRAAALAAAATLKATETVTTPPLTIEEAAAACELPMDATPEDVGRSLTIACAADRGALLVQEDMAVADAIELMQKEGQVAAVVLALGGGVLGLVTLEALQQQLAAALLLTTAASEEKKI